MIDPAHRPLLVPRPQIVDIAPGAVAVPRDLPRTVDQLLARRSLGQAAEQAHPGLALFLGMPAEHPEAYMLTIERIARQDRGAAPITISAADQRGLRRGLQTLRQLLNQYLTRIPCLSIHDRPAFATRGVMLDVSRCKVPTLEQLKQTVDLIASLKFNHLQLYTEHTFAYRGHEEVWQDASPITPEDVRALEDHALSRNVELAANQNCFGHLATWLRRPRYQHLAEIEGDNSWKFMQWERRGPFSLCPTNPLSQEFVRDLLGQLLPHFRSPLVNIGCDETFDVGWGRSRDEVQRRATLFDGDDAKARAALFFDFVEKIAGIVRDHGKRPMMWADIAMHHPEMLSRLPRDMIGLAWGYEPDARFADEAARFHAHGLASWVCPGTSSWRSITGRTTESRGNVLAAAACAGSPGVQGFLVCDWGDVGHMQHWPLTMMRLADAAEAAWNGPRALLDGDHSAAASLQVFDDPSRRIGPWIDELGDLDADLRTRCRVRNATAIFNDLFPPVPPPPGRRTIADSTPDDWQRLRDRLAELRNTRPTLENQTINAELDHTLELASLAIDHGLSCRRSPDGLRPLAADRPALSQQAEHAAAGLARLWTIRNRAGGLADARRHLERVIADLAAQAP